VGLWTGALRGRVQNGQVELCFGHRRLEAIRLLGWKEVEIDLQKLSDEEMSRQSLIENLQREELNDADRGEGIAAYLHLKMPDGNFTAVKISKQEIGRLLDLSPGRISQLLTIARWDEDMKKPVRERQIAGKSALAATQTAGNDAELAHRTVAAAAEKNLGFRTMTRIQTAFAELPENTDTEKKVTDKVRRAFANGKIDTAEDVQAKARLFRNQAIYRPDVPPDLVDVVRGVTERALRWTVELAEMAGYMGYLDAEPIVARRWRDATVRVENPAVPSSAMTTPTAAGPSWSVSRWYSPHVSCFVRASSISSRCSGVGASCTSRSARCGDVPPHSTRQTL
jgi:ParB/RepB/Spo0J family partition protein